jgi:hypothetical protein
MTFRSFLTAVAGMLLSAAVPAAPVVYSGAGLSTAQAEAAFANWQSGVGSFSVDPLAGLSGTDGFNANLTSAAGNTFASADDFLVPTSLTQGVMSGDVLALSRSGGLATLVWTLAQPANAFGFFGFDNDGGALTVLFVDGTSHEYAMNGAGEDDSIFWGITGLDSAIASITISTTDPGGVSYLDRFVTGASISAVPEPASLLLVGLGIAAAGAAHRRLRPR